MAEWWEKKNLLKNGFYCNNIFFFLFCGNKKKFDRIFFFFALDASDRNVFSITVKLIVIVGHMKSTIYIHIFRFHPLYYRSSYSHKTPWDIIFLFLLSLHFFFPSIFFFFFFHCCTDNYYPHIFLTLHCQLHLIPTLVTQLFNN